MTWSIEAARDICGLTGLRDPILFERLVHYGEKTRIGRAYSALSPCYPDVMSLEQWARDFEPAVIGATVANLKGEVAEPERVATAALGTFRDCLAKGAVAFDLAYTVFEVNADLAALHNAAAEVRNILSSLSAQSFSVLFFLFQDRGQSLPSFRAALNELVQFTEESLLDREGRAGKRTTKVFEALHAASDYLIDREDLEPWPAAKALAAMLDAHPDFEGKTVINIHNTICKRRDELNKSGNGQPVFLNPGPR